MNKIQFISETAELGFVKTRGFVYFEEDRICIEYQTMTNILNSEKSELVEFSIPFDQIRNIEFKKGMLSGGKLIISLNSIKNLIKVPFLKNSKLELKVSKEERDAMKEFSVVSSLEMSTYKLDQLN